MESSETLARRFFTLVADRDRAHLARLLHPDVVFTALTIPGVFVGRDEVMADFYEKVYAWPLYDAYATTFEQRREDTVRASGRLRWMTNGHLRDAAAEWMLNFRDGCLYRLTAENPHLSTAHRPSAGEENEMEPNLSGWRSS